MSTVIRISEELSAYLTAKKGSRRGWDSFLRRLFGLPSAKGKEQPLLEMWVLPRSGLAYHSAAKARGGAIMESVRTGTEKERPVLLREVI